MNRRIARTNLFLCRIIQPEEKEDKGNCYHYALGNIYVEIIEEVLKIDTYQSK